MNPETWTRLVDPAGAFDYPTRRPAASGLCGFPQFRRYAPAMAKKFTAEEILALWPTSQCQIDIEYARGIAAKIPMPYEEVLKYRGVGRKKADQFVTLGIALPSIDLRMQDYSAQQIAGAVAPPPQMPDSTNDVPGG